MAKHKRPARNSPPGSRAKSSGKKTGGRSRPKVVWLSAAERRIQRNLKPQFGRELGCAFPDANMITVCDCFHGYTRNQEEKAVLGVEVQEGGRYDSHIVKLGTAAKVRNDYRGFQDCIAGRPFHSRIFVNVMMHEVGNGRFAVIYEDAYQFFGEDSGRNNSREFDEVVQWAIKDDKPDPQSIVRVVRQIFADLYQWFYHAAEANSSKARMFFEKRLMDKAGKRGVLLKWNDESERAELRRDLDWLLCGQDKPDSERPPRYVDPFAYVTWAFAHDMIPQTLVGSSHGDLHGRNILVGVQGGEAEYPAIFDYGEMAPDNVLVWDFVKLETELKVRMIGHLIADDAACRSLLDQPCVQDHLKRYLDKAVAVPNIDSMQWQTRRELAFAFAFENCLACLMNNVHKTAEPAGGTCKLLAGNGSSDKLQRALSIFQSIRSEASVWLGEKQAHRGGRDRWRYEYYFALAVYGLASARFDYQPYETGFALVSAGVAAAQLSAAPPRALKYDGAKKKRPSTPCSYQPLLRDGYRLWKAGGRSSLVKAAKILSNAKDMFPFAVPLQREHALVMAELGEDKAARDQLEPLFGFCRSFLDYETLCRIGRTYKNMADTAWDANPVSYEEVMDHNLPVKQWYAAAYKFYREAFDFSRHYFPGVNAAFLAHFIGVSEPRKSATETAKEVAKELAHEVGAICAAQQLAGLSEDEHYWVLCSEGEAALIGGDALRSAHFYEQALSKLAKRNVGMAQPPYDQLCRLYQVLGESAVAPVVEVFANSGFFSELDAGPLGDCGYG